MRNFFILLTLCLLSIFLSFGLGCFYSYFYPTKYYQLINNLAEEYEVEGAVIAAIANVESNFNEKSVSSKGAIGVMQLIPSTAEWIAGKVGLEYSEEKLYDGDYNIRLGGYYISYLVDLFDDRDVAICAYNAGQGNVKLWLENAEYSVDGKTLKKIPFQETENYLNRVRKSYFYYKNRYK